MILKTEDLTLPCVLIFSLPLTLLSNIVNWSTLIFQGFVNFVIPCILFYKARKTYPEIRVPPQFRSALPGESTQNFNYNVNEDYSSGSSTKNSSSSDEDVKVDGKNINSLLSNNEGEPHTAPPTEEIDVASADTSYSSILRAVFVPYVDAVPIWLRVNPSGLAIAFAVAMSVLSFTSILMNIVFLALGINLVGWLLNCTTSQRETRHYCRFFVAAHADKIWQTGHHATAAVPQGHLDSVHLVVAPDRPAPLPANRLQCQGLYCHCQVHLFTRVTSNSCPARSEPGERHEHHHSHVSVEEDRLAQQLQALNKSQEPPAVTFMNWQSWPFSLKIGAFFWREYLKVATATFSSLPALRWRIPSWSPDWPTICLHLSRTSRQ